MFSLSDAWAQSAETRAAEGQKVGTVGHRIVPYTNPKHIEAAKADTTYDLDRYPFVRYELDTAAVLKISLGDTIPQELMEMPLRVVGKNTPSDTICLGDIANDKLVILDFWTTWCSPCVGSMNKWEAIQRKYSDDIVLLGIHMDYDFRAYPFIKERNWDSLSVISLSAHLLNRHFFDRRVISRMIWIRDGRFVAVTGTQGYDDQLLGEYIKDPTVPIPMNLDATYSRKDSAL